MTCNRPRWTVIVNWDVVDEGPMEDLLGIEVEYLADGSIKLHQRRYIEKIVARFLPKGPLPHVRAGKLAALLEGC